MTLNGGVLNIGDIIAGAETGNPANKVGYSKASLMLDILRELRTDLQSMNGWIAKLEQSQGTHTSETGKQHDPSTRWADHMDGLKVPMYTEPTFDD